MTYLRIGTNAHNQTLLCRVQLNIKSLCRASNVGVACRVWMRDYEASLQRRREVKVCFLSLTMANMVSPEGY